MISGAHIVIYTRNAEADRAFLRDILRFKSVDAGGGWLIFRLPPSEVACHPAPKNNQHELFFFCKNLKAEMARLARKGVRCAKVQKASWGSVTRMRLPGGGQIGLYQPRHPRP